MSDSEFRPGDWVIYRKQKISSSPGPRAHRTTAAPKGETYSYLIDKYWAVESVLEDGSLRIRTRRGKQHTVQADDPRLRKARWWQRWLLANRFPRVDATQAETQHG